MNGAGSPCGLHQPGFQRFTLNGSDTCTIINSASCSASVFYYLFLSKTHKWNSPTVQRIRGEGTMAGLLPHRNMLLGLVEREEGGAEAADRLGFSLLRWDIKLSLSAHALLTFIGPLKKANATRPRGKWSVCFVLNTLLTDCRAGMVWRTQTVCRPGYSPPCPTLV